MLHEFHYKFGHHTELTPKANVGERVKDLRIKLMREELQEVEEALDLGDLIGLADGLADLLYVVFGTAISYGIPIDKVFEEVHRSNMTKSMLKDEKGIKGKTLKGPDYDPPKLKEILGL